MTISLNSSLSAPADVLIRELDGEAVLLNLKSEAYFGLDEVGTRMWQVLTTSESIEAAYETLLAEYEVEPARLHQDLTGLIDRLVEHGLLEVSGA
jgi:hypothetical protein